MYFGGIPIVTSWAYGSGCSNSCSPTVVGCNNTFANMIVGEHAQLWLLENGDGTDQLKPLGRDAAVAKMIELHPKMKSRYIPPAVKK